MRITLFALVAGLLVATSAFAQSPRPQSTYTDTAEPNRQKYYAFTLGDSGQLTATLSWDNQASNLLMVLVCTRGGGEEPVSFGVAAGRLDRTARLEAGVLTGLNCVLGVSTADIVAAYRLNVQLSAPFASQPFTPTSTARITAGAGDAEAELIAYANRTLQRLR
jgi:hypothetical protein